MHLLKKTILVLPLVLTATEARPSTIQQVGANDFQVSDMQGEPFQNIAGQSDVGFNTHNREYLVVWAGTDAPAAPVEIYGQRLASDGAHTGSFNFKISQLSQGNPSFDSYSPSVVYNPDRQEYLVVWYGSDFFLGNNGLEIFGQRLAADGSSIGANFRISDMGDETNAYDAFNPAVVYNSNDQEYLVVWYADDNTAGLVDNEFEIHGQLLNDVGGEIGGDFRISAMGGTGDPNDDAFEPDVAFDPANSWYLVVWHGDANAGSLVDDEFEIFGQLLDSSGQHIGSDDFRISDLGGSGDADFDALFPVVDIHPITGQWWVFWHGDDDQGGLIDDELEIFGQRLTSSGAETGTNDFRVSSMGGTGRPGFIATSPDLAIDALQGEVVVTWSGNDRADDQEIHATRLRSDGTLTGRSVRLSDVGPASDPTYYADNAAIIQNTHDGQFLVIFTGRDDAVGHLVDELDIFGQRISLPLFCDGFESGDVNAWSQAVGAEGGPADG